VFPIDSAIGRVSAETLKLHEETRRIEYAEYQFNGYHYKGKLFRWSYTTVGKQNTITTVVEIISVRALVAVTIKPARLSINARYWRRPNDFELLYITGRV